MAKMNQKMITLCSAAIGAVYIAGYFVTEPAEQSMAQQPKTNMVAKVDKGRANMQTSYSTTQQPKKHIQQAPRMYQDGTFQGQGSNHIGSVTVAVTIKNDRITNVQITDCTTSYSESYIQGLPNQVIARQSPNVDVVSGATRSTEDFQAAVEEALQNAKV